MGPREIGREIGVSHPQRVKHHLNQLKKKGLLAQKEPSSISKLRKNLNKQVTGLVDIPILGSANCGIATIIAEESLEGFLKISSKLLGVSRPEKLFALRASGNSLNKASIDGESVKDGDYLIVDTNYKNPRDGEYVVSVIDGCANVKKIRLEQDKIVLLSESSEDIPPIYIHSDDSYLINGKVTKIIKSNTGGDKK
jgi:repressor LexA